MDLTGQKTPAIDLSLSDLRQLGRDEIAELVTAGLLEADRAAEIQSEDFERKQDEQQVSAAQHFQAQKKAEEEKQDADWLQSMSQSYQRAYHQLMDTYDNANSEYGEIKTRAEKLRERLREKGDTAFGFGVPLADGRLAFYDRQKNDFVDGVTFQPLQGIDAKTAAEEFKKLSPRQQQENASYVDTCTAYADAENISQSADAGRTGIERSKNALKNSEGSISEDKLKNAGKQVDAQVDDLSKRLDKAEKADANLDAALSADEDDADTPHHSTSQTRSVSFASQIDANTRIIGDGNGKTSNSFNTAAAAKAGDEIAVVNNAVGPVNRLPVVSTP